VTDREESGAQAPGPRHAAQRASVRSRLRGRALAIAAVPTALLVGAAYTPTTLASADTQSGKTCASTPDNTVLEETPVPKSEIKVAQPSGTTASGTTAQKSAAQPGTAAAVPAVFTTTTTGSTAATTTGGTTGGVQQVGLIDDILNGIFHPAGTATPSPSPSPSTAVKSLPSPSTVAPAPSATKPAPGTSPAPTASPSAQPTAGASTGTSTGAAKPAASPSASASAGPNCLVDARSLSAKAAPGDHVVPEQNWVLHSSKLALHGSVFNGVYDVQMASGATKRVLKFTTASVDIGDLDMSTIEIPGLTFHVKSRPGSTSTMRNGPITMYVESLSGHLSAIYGLPIPIDLGEITLTPDTLPKWLWDLIGAVPIPLDITLDKAKAVQAGQFGGDLKIPGMRLFNDKAPYDG